VCVLTEFGLNISKLNLDKEKAYGVILFSKNAPPQLKSFRKASAIMVLKINKWHYFKINVCYLVNFLVITVSITIHHHSKFHGNQFNHYKFS